MDLELFMVEKGTSVKDGMSKIGENNKGIIFVCQGRKLISCVTDGDIRRHLLRGGGLSDDITAIGNVEPVYLSVSDQKKAETLMLQKGIRAVPVLDSQRQITDILFLHEDQSRIQHSHLGIPLVIMAGGKGTRLKPYTDILPKPLIPVGDKTITEHIMDRFGIYGCENITMIVNYKKDFIKAYFKDNEVARNITFIEEQEYLGTGGGLKLLEPVMHDTFFMSNCDVLIDADYEEILKYHRNAGNIITLVCARKKFEVPYGTIQTDIEGKVTGLKEKPGFEYKVNTGFYLIEPKFLGRIPEATFIHITDVIEKCIQMGDKVGSFLIDEASFMDMGQMDELEKMKNRLQMKA